MNEAYRLMRPAGAQGLLYNTTGPYIYYISLEQEKEIQDEPARTEKSDRQLLTGWTNVWTNVSNGAHPPNMAVLLASSRACQCDSPDYKQLPRYPQCTT